MRRVQMASTALISARRSPVGRGASWVPVDAKRSLEVAPLRELPRSDSRNRNQRPATIAEATPSGSAQPTTHSS